jgi:hypothetical protein
MVGKNATIAEIGERRHELEGAVAYCRCGSASISHYSVV